MWQRIAAKDTDGDLLLVQREALLATQMQERYQQAYQAVADYDFATAAQKLGCPVMLCAGTEDVLYPLMDDCLAILANGKKTEIAGAKTYVCERNVEELSQLMADFFQ